MIKVRRYQRSDFARGMAPDNKRNNNRNSIPRQCRGLFEKKQRNNTPTNKFVGGTQQQPQQQKNRQALLTGGRSASILRMMINRRIIILIITSAVAAMALGGCRLWGGESAGTDETIEFTDVENLTAAGNTGEEGESATEPTVVAGISRPLPPPGRPDEQLLYRLRVYYITERVEEGKAPAGLWHLVDEQAVDERQRQLLRANGMRVATGGELSLDRINAALGGGGVFEISQAPEAFGKPGLFLDIPLGKLEEDTMIMHVSRNGGMAGREFSQGSTVLRFQCVPPEGAGIRGAIEVRLGPYVVYGEQRGTPPLAVIEGRATGGGRPMFAFRDLETRVRLQYGEFVIVGLEPGRDLTIGRQLFVSGEMADRKVKAVVLVPELSWLGNMPTERLIYSHRTITPGRDE